LSPNSNQVITAFTNEHIEQPECTKAGSPPKEGRSSHKFRFRGSIPTIEKSDHGLLQHISKKESISNYKSISIL
jgi:hypothetical protein